MRKEQLITLEDLDNFKVELLDGVKQLLKECKGQPAKQWIKTSELVKSYKFSPGKLQKMRDQGLLAFTRIGGDIYYDQDDIKAMFEQLKTPALK
ncbi:helix-turn-helix domain-containing protein [Chitinophaga niabensis]|uniref:Helix-turn-helix domain-containing protein n=1 Tax=Chitinophaga niabensis TaxID=536979 RepID=A0A1N6E5K7_9BACT|nr:helix-turn-helix domain-containing protein [Chitinophaga niabensis]SIN78253.1 hypothetical protein SAMN04488055_1317 [Chitinophaga niabensis]